MEGMTPEDMRGSGKPARVEQSKGPSGKVDSRGNQKADHWVNQKANQGGNREGGVLAGNRGKNVAREGTVRTTWVE
jgi:hypothetical protein